MPEDGSKATPPKKERAAPKTTKLTPEGPDVPEVNHRTNPKKHGKSGEELIRVYLPKEIIPKAMNRDRIAPSFGAKVREWWERRPTEKPPQAEFTDRWPVVARGVYMPKGTAKEIGEFEKAGFSFDAFILARIEAALR